MTIFLPDGTTAMGTPEECAEMLKLYGRGPMTINLTGTGSTVSPTSVWCQEHGRWDCQGPHVAVRAFGTDQ